MFEGGFDTGEETLPSGGCVLNPKAIEGDNFMFT